MTIVEALKSSDVYGIRVSCGNRWMVWDASSDRWAVYEHNYRPQKSTHIFSSLDEEIAIEYLCKG